MVYIEDNIEHQLTKEVITGMSSVSLFDKTVQTTNEWLKDVSDETGREDPQKVIATTRAVLWALRDRLTVEECADLAAQFPTLLRGIFFEGWRPATVPVKERTREGFLRQIRTNLGAHDDIDPLNACRAVFAVLEKRISEGELNDLKSVLPENFLEFFPTSPVSR